MAPASESNFDLVKRPVLDVPRTALEKVLNVLSVLGLVVSWGVALRSWPHLPARIPIHFNFAGEVNGWGGRGSLLTLPILATIIVILFLVLQHFPHSYNYPWQITPENATRQYKLARLLLAGLGFVVAMTFPVLLRVVIEAAKRGHSHAPWLVPCLVGVHIVVLASYFIAAYRAR